MKRDLPPSKVERTTLVGERKRDLPKTSPAPAPMGMGASTDPTLTAQRRAAKTREMRIKTIDRSLGLQANRAARAFSRSR